MGKDNILELLESADWNDIILRLSYHAVWRARRYKWRSGDFTRLPGGKAPEDFAIEAIEKVWNGQRNWNPEKYPILLHHLMWIVDSDLDHAFNSLEHRSTGRAFSSEDYDGSEPNHEKADPNSTSSIHNPPLTPEENMIASQDREMEEEVKKQLYTAVEGDEDLELLLICIEEGFDNPDLIAAKTGWDIKKVYNLKRKLLRRGKKIIEEMNLSPDISGRKK